MCTFRIPSDVLGLVNTRVPDLCGYGLADVQDVLLAAVGREFIVFATDCR